MLLILSWINSEFCCFCFKINNCHHPSPSIIIHHHPSPSIIIHHHPSSSIIIHHHPSSSIIIHHHPPSSTIIITHHHPRPLQPCAPSEPCQPLELVPMALMVTLTKVDGNSHGYWPRHLFSYFADLLLQICDTLVWGSTVLRPSYRSWLTYGPLRLRTSGMRSPQSFTGTSKA